MRIPQILIICLYMLDLGATLANHGKTELKEYNFGSRLVSCIIVIGLLVWGGFFS